MIHGPRWFKPFGWCRMADRRIEIWPVAWAPTWFGLRDLFELVTWNHEALHAWGNKGCANVWCLGYEGPKWKEYLAMPVQLLGGLEFCPECLGHYKVRS